MDLILIHDCYTRKELSGPSQRPLCQCSRFESVDLVWNVSLFQDSEKWVKVRMWRYLGICSLKLLLSSCWLYAVPKCSVYLQFEPMLFAGFCLPLSQARQTVRAIRFEGHFPSPPPFLHFLVCSQCFGLIFANSQLICIIGIRPETVPSRSLAKLNADLAPVHVLDCELHQWHAASMDWRWRCARRTLTLRRCFWTSMLFP